MIPRIGQASRSENKSDPAWGMPPNQLRTGAHAGKPQGNMDGELNVMNWYRLSGDPWRFRWRAKDPMMRERIATLMEKAVANGKYIGYGQYNGSYPRTGVFDNLNAMITPDTAKIKTLCNCDCSSLVGACVYFAGVEDIRLRTMWTGTMEFILDSTGAFEKTSENLDTYKGMLRGDILLNKGHTCVVLDSDYTNITKPYEIANCYQCNLRAGDSTEYPVIKVLNEGDIVGLISWATSGWGQVRVNNLVGYVSPKYLKELDQYAMTKQDAWLREDAGVQSKGLKVIPNGTIIALTGETQKVKLTTWWRAVYDGTVGWVSNKMLK